MKKNVLVAIATTLVLAACACDHPMHAQKMGSPAIDPETPGVFVLDDKIIVVNQEPIFFAKGKQNVRITWYLPADSKYRFPKDGIVIKDPGDQIIDCHQEQNGLRFSCLNKHSQPGKYKYTIKVEGSPPVTPSDPIILND